MNDCCPVREWVTGKPTLTTGSNRCFAVNQLASGNVCFEYITAKGKHFIAAPKGNRLVAVSEDDRRNKRFVAVDKLEFA